MVLVVGHMGMGQGWKWTTWGWGVDGGGPYGYGAGMVVDYYGWWYGVLMVLQKMWIYWGWLGHMVMGLGCCWAS